MSAISNNAATDKKVLYNYMNLKQGTKIQVRTRILLPTGSVERGVLGVGTIPVAILPSCQNMKMHYNAEKLRSVNKQCK